MTEHTENVSETQGRAVQLRIGRRKDTGTEKGQRGGQGPECTESAAGSSKLPLSSHGSRANAPLKMVCGASYHCGWCGWVPKFTIR